MSLVVCIEDDPALLRTLATNFEARGLRVLKASTGTAGLELASSQRPDVVIVDLGLPDVSGLTVIRRLRQWSSVPIIVLSARDAELDKVAALEAGADDYVSKPFGMGELIARVRASLRRSVVGQSEPIVKTAHFTIDLSRRTVVGELGESKLTPTEWSIVEHLVRNPERLVSSKELLQVVWGPEYSTETNYLRVHLTHIRQKLEPDPPRPVYFVTEPGMGYRFVPNPR